MARTGNGLTIAHQGKGLLKVTFITKFPLDQAGQGRPLFKGKEHRSGQITSGQVAGGRFAQFLVAAGEIEDVIDDLESQAQLSTELVKASEPLWFKPGENTAGSGAVGH